MFAGYKSGNNFVEPLK